MFDDPVIAAPILRALVLDHKQQCQVILKYDVWGISTMKRIKIKGKRTYYKTDGRLQAATYTEMTRFYATEFLLQKIDELKPMISPDKSNWNSVLKNMVPVIYRVFIDVLYRNEGIPLQQVRLKSHSDWYRLSTWSRSGYAIELLEQILHADEL
jgi:hypothetical protein